jgi:succinyl-CoA synthetase beta subunit
MGIPAALTKDFVKILGNMVRMMMDKDCSLIEINPLVETADGKLLALDAKVNFDDSGLVRHPELEELRDIDEEDPKEYKASLYDLNYISLFGNIGCLVNGAGLAMATMDTINKFGGSPANFLDLGGSTTEDKVAAALEILMTDPHVEVIMINIFGGIVKCDLIASGIVSACGKLGLKVPMIVRLEGTNVDAGKKILAESGLNIIPAKDLADAAHKAVEAAKGGAK